MGSHPPKGRGWALAALVLLAAGGSGSGAELDPGRCRERFDVRRDEIIRTEESRAMGARYISELEVGARDECARLCCETDACDVFVYEEKSGGSCYLFECGPPEDFLCKFTRHGNFSSGVMAIGRRVAEMQDREMLLQHERELAGLRSKRPPSTTTSSSSLTVTVTKPPPIPVQATPPPPPPSPRRPPPTPQSKTLPLLREGYTREREQAGRGSVPSPLSCSAYQFQCHGSGECIAVYNACDGVPQCADGSDEAPGLGCPVSASAPARPVLTVPVPSQTSAQAAPSHTPRQRERYGPLRNEFAQQEPMEGQGLVDLGAGAGAGAAAGLGPDLDGGQHQGRVQWPYRLSQEQPQIVSYMGNGPSSHIFNHKGGLLQVQDSDGSSVAMANSPRYVSAPAPALSDVSAPGAEWSRHNWQQRAQPNIGGNGVGNGAMSSRGWPAAGGGPGYGQYLEWGEEPQQFSPPRRWPESSHPERPFYQVRPPPAVLIAPQLGDERSVPYSGPGGELRDAPKKGPQRDQEHETQRHRSTSAPSPSPPTTTTTGGPHSQRSPPSAPAPEPHTLTEEEHDGLSERPPGAILLLVLGLGMTSVVAAMLVCRARGVRRRFRRGKPTLAHDPDYLVNGMYL